MIGQFTYDYRGLCRRDGIFGFAGDQRIISK